MHERIRRNTEAHFTRASSDRAAIERRLKQLDGERPIERALQTNFGILSLVGITLGALLVRPWFLVSGIAAGFMVQHAVRGSCPPMRLLRRLGFRTTREIDHERYALKALRGDFQKRDSSNPSKVFQASSA